VKLKLDVTEGTGKLLGCGVMPERARWPHRPPDFTLLSCCIAGSVARIGNS
jgi:hypothetical protein